MGQWAVNLWEDGSVIIQDGEDIGTWDEEDGAIFAFTPHGAEDVLIREPFMGPFCGKIAEWWKAAGA